MRVMPHSHTLTARVSMTWTISRPLSLLVCMEACMVGGGTTHNLLLLLRLWLQLRASQVS